MGMISTWMMLLVMLTQGGGGDLLDQVQTDAYWQAKSVTVTAQTMREMAAAGTKADVSREIAQLSSADADQRIAAMKAIIAAGPGALGQLEELAASTDPKLSKIATNLSQQIKKRSNDGAVRQLMAIRTLGELGDKDSLPVLKGLLESREAFVADYAQAAIGRIEGKPLVRAELAEADREKDMKLLPGNCGLVAQMSMAGRTAPPAPRKEGVPATRPAVGPMDRRMISLAETIGNVRLASLTVGVGEDVGPSKGFVVVVARGVCDRATVTRLLSQQGAKTSVVGKTTVYSTGGSVRVILAEDGRVIFIMGANPEQLPVEAVVAGIEGTAAGLESNPAMTQLLGGVDRKLPVWAAARMADGYKALPLPPTMPLPFDSLYLTGQRGDGGLKLRLQGIGADAGAIEAAGQAYKDLLAKGVANLQRTQEILSNPAPDMPHAASQASAVRVIRDFLMGITVQAKDKELSMEGELRVDEQSLPSLMGVGF